MEETTAIILAGGQSSRMGQNKALLDIEGKTVIERIVTEIDKVVDHKIIATNTFSDYEFLNLPMVEDNWKGIGPLGGIQAGLTASQTDRNIIIACDMPFISSQIASFLLSKLSEYDGVVPIINGRIHPLFAAYRRDVRHVIEKLIKANRHRITYILPEIHGKVLTEIDLENEGFDLSEYEFFNMNDPGKYKEAIQMAKPDKESRD